MIDIDHLRQWIGRREEQSELLTPAIAARFNATFDRVASVGTGEVAPPLIHFCLAPPAVPNLQLGPDGHPSRGGFLPPVPLPQRMWAGGAFLFQGDIKIGETVTRRSTIQDVTLKEGRSGALCFVTVEHHIDSDGRPVLTERQDIVYRQIAGSSASRKASPPAPHGKHRVTIQPSPVLLFRYSALTFNGHRIHYDLPYARDVEGHPGLIVHGPLQATMLTHFAERIHGERPAKFRFRSLSPLFDDRAFTLNAVEDGASLKLWTSSETGPVAMEALAEW